jgi:HprK-related kinase A
VTSVQASSDVRATSADADAPSATAELRILSFRARVRADRPEIVDHLAELYPSAPASKGTYASEVVVAERAGRHEIVVDGEPVGSVSSLAEAVARVEYLINRAAAVALADHLLVHAGVVATRDGVDAIVLPGPSGRGKSTLVAGLCLSGLAYASDELAVVDPITTAVRPFTKAICLKEGGWNVIASHFPEAAPRLVAPGDGGMTRYLTPAHLCRSDAPMRVRYVVLPLRRPGAAADLAPIHRSEAIAELAEHALNLPRHGYRGVEALVELAAGAECYALTYDDLDGAVARLTELTGRPEARLAMRGR